MPNPTIIAFGHEAGSGKDSCADYLEKAYGACNVLRISFATALRFEVHQEVRQIMADYMCPGKEAIELLCQRKGVKYDPFAKVEKDYPFTKQRQLFQHWGMMRRAESSSYWVDKVAEVIDSIKPSIVLISDLRFKNEADWINAQGGTTVRVHRPDHTLLTGDAAKHVSENELADYTFDHTILNDGSLSQLHKKANSVMHAVTQLGLFQGNQ